jgi:hypothetical protein
MSTGNPYEPSSMPPLGKGPGGDVSLAASKVSGPATGLIVVGVIYVLMALFGLVNSTRTMMAGPADIEAQMTEEQRQQLEELKSQGVDPQMIMKIAQTAGGPIGMALSLVNVVVAGAVIIGGQKMKNLQSRGLAMTAAILAMIPCLTPSLCCVIGLPIGIWAITALNDPNVKSAFAS